MHTKPIYPIVFLKTTNLEKTNEFYNKILKLPQALNQGGCIIYQVGKYGYWGFCETKEENMIQDTDKICLTLVVENKEEVDEWYNYLVKNDINIIRTPEYTKKYKIYNGFYSDPMGYTLEIQSFDEDGKPVGHDEF